jgi:glycosyltransferase involved in cell wall biosynthesis
MHGGYFDLRALPGLSQQVPTVLTLHDAWLLSGHCAHSFDCERWKTGCGSCPDLDIPPDIQRDATAYNWKNKREIYSKSRLYVATPCEWLMSKVRNSILAEGIVESRVIPYGIDSTAFCSSPREAARAELGIPSTAKVILFVANGIQRNRWKDYTTLRKAIGLLSSRMQDTPLLFIGLGEDAPPERFDAAELRFLPYQKDPATVRKYYRSADIYAHAAHADTFPNVVLEALACGAPVVATAIGGIPEQVKGLRTDDTGLGFSPEGATGILAPPGDAEAMASGFERLLTNDSLRGQLAANAPKDMVARFSMERQVESYLGWYDHILGRSPGSRGQSKSVHLNKIKSL